MSNYSIIFGPADVSHSMEDMRILVNSDQLVAQRFKEVSRFSGVSISELLKGETQNASLSRLQVISLGLFAGMLGIADRVALTKGEPCSVGGISLGELVAICFSSAISVEDATSIILCEHGYLENVKSAPEAVGFVFIPKDGDPLPEVAGVYIAVDYGYVHKGAGSLLMLSGLRENLENAATSPWEIEILPEELCNSAHHSELRKPVSKRIELLVKEMQINDCRYPVNTCFNDLDRLNNSQDVRQSLVMNDIKTLHVSNLIETQKQDELSQVVCIGPFLRSLSLSFGLPAEYFDEKWVLSSTKEKENDRPECIK